jgi:hypothetical protein
MGRMKYRELVGFERVDSIKVLTQADDVDAAPVRPLISSNAR